MRFLHAYCFIFVFLAPIVTTCFSLLLETFVQRAATFKKIKSLKPLLLFFLTQDNKLWQVFSTWYPQELALLCKHPQILKILFHQIQPAFFYYFLLFSFLVVSFHVVSLESCFNYDKFFCFPILSYLHSHIYFSYVKPGKTSWCYSADVGVSRKPESASQGTWLIDTREAGCTHFAGLGLFRDAVLQCISAIVLLKQWDAELPGFPHSVIS